MDVAICFFEDLGYRRVYMVGIQQLPNVADTLNWQITNGCAKRRIGACFELRIFRRRSVILD